MRPRFTRSLATALGAVLLATVAAADQPKRAFEQISYPKLNEIKQPNVTRHTLPNGIKVLMIEDHELPRVSFRALVGGGRIAEPAGKVGLAELFGEAHRTGGTKTLTGDLIDERLERIGASVESSVAEAYSVVFGQTLVEHVDTVLPVFAELITAPAFAEDKVELAKTHLRSAIARRNDDVMGIARRELGKLVYGASSPYARQYEYADIDRLTRDDLQAFHGMTFRPDGTIIAVWGDFKTAEMKTRLAKALGTWTVKGAKPAVSAPAVTAPKPSINYIEKKDIEQTFILAGQLGTRWDDPDYPAIYVLSDILGGGFASRLFSKIRTEKGLAYGAGGWMSPAYDHAGVFSFFTSTKPASTAEALSTMLEEIGRIRTEPVTESELSRAKDSYLNSYAFEYDSTAKIVNRLLTYEFYGYPVDFNAKLRDRIEKVTREDVLRVAQKHLDPTALTILAIGRKEQFDRPLDTFGKVTTISIAIPEPKEEVADASDESLARGRELLLKAARFVGETALAGLKDVTAETTNSVVTPMGAMDLKATTTFVLPARQHNQLSTPMGAMTQVVDGDRAWMAMGPQTRDLPESAAAEMRRGLLTDLGCALLLQQALAGAVQGQYLADTDLEGRQAADVFVTTGEDGVHLLIDASTGELLGTRKTSQTQEGPAEVTTLFSRWQEVSGLKVPFLTQQKVKDEVKATTTIESIKLNAGFSEDLFAKPAAAAAK